MLAVMFCLSPPATSAQESQEAKKASLPKHPLRSRRRIESMLALAPKLPAADKLRQLNIVLLSDKKDEDGKKAIEKTRQQLLELIFI